MVWRPDKRKVAEGREGIGFEEVKWQTVGEGNTPDSNDQEILRRRRREKGTDKDRKRAWKEGRKHVKHPFQSSRHHPDPTSALCQPTHCSVEAHGIRCVPPRSIQCEPLQ